MAEGFWIRVDASGGDVTDVCNLPTGVLIKIRNNSGSLVSNFIPGIIFEDNSFRKMTMDEMMGGDDLSKMFESLGGGLGGLGRLSSMLKR